ncbi:NADH dehydrogenase [ubiquinone] 1 alpha subcomplex subunit 2 [Smittium culicis]|uniref:NADH dehydrogenase [ubiquinone] 1 alpha subcomplex subunit 2 n=1 Tax=Smittium culicis TaxID=133412 RepID=A0A1R1YM26_9FUNG|nr:NADH dehydrogenase [ubiquinone] 1 alpha subcomplex subunit 2 [Smittium culicis]OMJ27923.1 NADH dehydrogenase [ubiquinone] 1 alpha subcomplex subunit 2 [Smittium culicis]
MNAFSKSLREIRVHLSPSSPASQGLRSFILNKYSSIKASNPNMPILVREAENVESRIIARFEKGIEKKVVLDNASEEEVSKLFKTLVQ